MDRSCGLAAELWRAAVVLHLRSHGSPSIGALEASWRHSILLPAKMGCGLVAYRSQFLDADNRAHAGQAKIKSRLIGDLDPEEWDLPPKPKWMRWSTYNRHVERYDRYEAILDDGIAELVAKLEKDFL